MPIRPIVLPRDLTTLTDLIVETFQYPENPAWSVQLDERDQLVEGMKNIRGAWPLIRVIQAFSPALRDILRGVVWEEAGQPVGVVTVQRRGTTDDWWVGTVGVLPSHRRRGIARTLVESGLELIKAHGGARSILTVIDGNVPAYALYEALGFERYSGDVLLQAEPGLPVPEVALSDGYLQERGDVFDWRPRYEFERRICPQAMERYEPVQEGRFRQPALTRLLLPLLQFAQRTREEFLLIRTDPGGEVVATGRTSVSTSGKGPSQISARLDPSRSELAPYLVGHLVKRVLTQAPDQRVQFDAALWMDALIVSAEKLGLERRLAHHRMGRLLQDRQHPRAS